MLLLCYLQTKKKQSIDEQEGQAYLQGCLLTEVKIASFESGEVLKQGSDEQKEAPATDCELSKWVPGECSAHTQALAGVGAGDGEAPSGARSVHRGAEGGGGRATAAAFAARAQSWARRVPPPATRRPPSITRSPT